MKILVTGSAGFIGRNLCNSLLTLGHSVHGVDNLNDDFNQAELKRDRTASLAHFDNFTFYHMDIYHASNLQNVFTLCEGFDVVYHLAAQPGVNQSVNYPQLFTDTNLVGFANILEICRKYHTPHLIFASSSSVYGDAALASVETDNTDYPKSYYAATKKANEVMAASYSHMYNLRISGVRFFTVYGPWGRPDMATWKFTEAILNKKPIVMYNNGDISRDFTYIDDTVDCLIKLSDDHHQRPHLSSLCRFQIYNIGTSKPIKISTYVKMLEKVTGLTAIKASADLASSEALHTFSDMTKFKRHYSSEVKHTGIEKGLENFVEWFKKYQCTKL